MDSDIIIQELDDSFEENLQIKKRDGFFTRIKSKLSNLWSPEQKYYSR